MNRIGHQLSMGLTLGNYLNPPEGIPGEDVMDGENGTDGENGIDATGKFGICLVGLSENQIVSGIVEIDAIISGTQHYEVEILINGYLN